MVDVSWIESSGAARRASRLARLWAAVDRFHPSADLAEWDSAVMQLLPRVVGDTDSATRRLAVRALLDVLDDPTTEVGAPRPQPGDATLMPQTGRCHPDEVVAMLGDAVVLRGRELHRAEGTAELSSLLAAVAPTLRSANRVVLDMREAGPHLTRAVGQLLAPLLPASVVLPSVVRRLTPSIDPEIFAIDATGPAEVHDAARPLGTAESDSGRTWVVVLDGDSSALRLAAGMRMGVGAAVAQVGDTAAPATLREVFDLGDVHVSLGLTRLDVPGWAITPDRVLGQPATDDEVWAAAAALSPDPALRRGLRGTSPPLLRLPGPLPDHAAGRCLALFRLWAQIAYHYPYIDGIEGNWDALVEDLFDDVVRSDDVLVRHRALAGAVTRLRDGHGALVSPVLEEWIGTDRPEALLDEVEGRPCVVACSEASRLRRGDVVLAVDGVHVETRVGLLSSVLPASHASAARRRAVRRSADGARGTVASLRIERDGVTLTVDSPRVAGVHSPDPQREVLDEVEGVAYVDAGRLLPHQVEDAAAAIAGARAAVIDLRGYPNATGALLASRLARRPEAAARVAAVRRDAPIGSLARRWQPSTTVVTTTHVVNPAVGSTPPAGRLVLLVDVGTISQGEHTVLLLKAAVPEAVVVGQRTAGANGNATSVLLHADARVLLTGLGAAWGDGTTLQRVGVVPDVPAERSIDGVRKGVDELLVTALDVARRSTTT